MIFLFKTSKGMTLIEMAAVVVVTGIIALGMTMGTRGGTPSLSDRSC